MREGYLEIARADKSRVVVLNADREPDALHADVVRAVDELLARRGGAHVALDAIRDQARGGDAAAPRDLARSRVAHAYAFVGPEGSGRKATALAFATALVAPPGGPAAARVERGSHPDVHLLGPTPPASNPKGTPALRIETIRELERLAALKPAEAPWKVFIVDEAEKMTGATPQAFLKTLEEPPARTVIILILSQIRALPATVLSRCQVVRFRPRLAEGTPALLPDGRGEAQPAALRLLAEAREQGVEAILRLGDAVGRDRAGRGDLRRDVLALVPRSALRALAGGPPRLAVFGEAGRAGRRHALARSGAGRARAIAARRGSRSRATSRPGSRVEVLLGRLAGKAA